MRKPTQPSEPNAGDLGPPRSSTATPPDGPIKFLQIALIRRDFQDDECLFEDKVSEYVSMIRRRDKIPPVLVYCDGRNYWLADGFHRVTAAQRLGRKRIRAMIVPGTYAQMEAESREETKAGLQDLHEWAEQNKRVRATSE